ncbi:hypothetical protein ABEB36_000877 [Hypothenemus hampei]|uniref:Uncharacterized protein n=1 Tax=Hypothenemus hampei TaxID=57062 RepID=A0ABD1FCR1_HYPHA
MDMDVKLYQLSKDDIEILEIYNPGINVGLKIRRLGKLKNDKIILEPFESYYESRKNMSGVLIRSANVIKYPFTGTFHEYMVDTQLMKHDIYSKFHYQLFLGLVEIHGFAYNTTLSVSWFGNTSRGEDGGVAKLLWDEDIEISSAGCVIRLLLNDRIDYFDFIMPYYKFRSCFYFRNPGLVKPNFQEVLKPFAKQTWFVALYVTGIICVCIEISYFIHSNRTWSSLVSFRSIFYVIAAFSQQSIDVPTQLASRIIFLHLLICSVLLYNYYTSSLVSSLISTEPEVMKTIKELVESNLKVGLELQPYLITFILDRVKEDPDIDLLNKTKFYERNELNVFSAEEGVRRVHEGEFAYHLESVTAYSLISDSFEQESICDLAEIPLIQSDTSLMTKKKCEYKKLFQISLRKMWQSGIIKKLYKTWVMGKPECLSSTRVISVTVNDLFLPYFLFVLGVLGSIVVLIIEIIWNKCKYQSLHDRNIKIVVPFES